MLPIRTQLLAKQLRSILRTFNQQANDLAAATLIENLTQLSPVPETHVDFAPSDQDAAEIVHADEVDEEDIGITTPELHYVWKAPWRRSEQSGYRIMSTQTISPSDVVEIGYGGGSQSRSVNTLDSWVVDSNSSSTQSKNTGPVPLELDDSSSQPPLSMPQAEAGYFPLFLNHRIS